MRNAILYIFSLIVSAAVGIAAYGSYLSHDYSMSTKPETTIQYVYIEREPEVITETVYIEVEPTFYRSLTEDDCFYLCDLAMRESENQGVVGMLWVMYTAECRAEAYGLTYEEVKAAYNTMFVKDRDLTEVEDKACRIARSVMYGYARKAEVPAEVPAEA